MLRSSLCGVPDPQGTARCQSGYQAPARRPAVHGDGPAALIDPRRGWGRAGRSWVGRSSRDWGPGRTNTAATPSPVRRGRTTAREPSARVGAVGLWGRPTARVSARAAGYCHGGASRVGRWACGRGRARLGGRSLGMAAAGSSPAPRSSPNPGSDAGNTSAWRKRAYYVACTDTSCPQTTILTGVKARVTGQHVTRIRV